MKALGKRIGGAPGRLSRIYGDDELERQAVGVLRLVHTALGRVPSAFGWALCALDLYLSPPRELAIIGSPGDELARAALAPFEPNSVAAFGPSEEVPLLAGKVRVDGKPTLYLCERFACQSPVRTRHRSRSRRLPAWSRRVRTRRVERGEVERRLVAGDELRNVLADRRRLLEAVAGEAGRVEEAFRIGCAADQRVVIGAHLVIAPPRRLHRQVDEHRQPAQACSATSSSDASFPPKTSPGPSRWK